MSSRSPSSKKRSSSQLEQKKERPRSSSRKGGLEQGHGKGGLEKGQPIRGGANRKPSLDMNEEELSQAFDKVIRTRGKGAFDLGAYNTLGVAQAASAKGLVDCQCWLTAILPLCDGIPKHLPLKKQVLRFPEWNGTDQKHPVWAGSIASKMQTIFNHWRRLKQNSERRRQCLQKASVAEAYILEELLAMKPGYGEVWKKASSASTNGNGKDDMGVGEACDKASDMEVDKSWLGDDGEISEVSIDSKGFPMILKTPEASRKGSGEAAASSGLKQGPSSPKAAGARGLKESQSPDSARLPFLSKRAQSHKAALEQQAAEAAERLATKSHQQKKRKPIRSRIGLPWAKSLPKDQQLPWQGRGLKQGQH
jgi:hypothetical protein